MIDLVVVGKRCAEYRRKVLRTTQRDISRDLGSSVENISAFERGINDNSLIFLWYLSHGLTISQIMGDDLIE